MELGALECPSFLHVSSKDESGATAIEYGLIAALIALAIMVGAGNLGNSLNNQFGRISDQAGRQRE